MSVFRIPERYICVVGGWTNDLFHLRGDRCGDPDKKSAFARNHRWNIESSISTSLPELWQDRLARILSGLPVAS